MSFAQASAQNQDACVSGVQFGFFNGVLTTSQAAGHALEILKERYGDTTPDGRHIRYQNYYNYTMGLADFVETFSQRLREQRVLADERFELFWEALSGGGEWWEALEGSISSFVELRQALTDKVQAGALNKLTSLLASPPTLENYLEHVATIDSALLEGNALVFLAHSQGNLFVNEAYQYATTGAPPAAVRVIHVAPASPKLNGPHTLADQDLVINGLRLFGSVGDITDQIPIYGNRPPGQDMQSDPLGHGLIPIYLNSQLSTSARIDGHVQDALATVKSPTQGASKGFLTASLTWDGAGDADLHVLEPNGQHVYWEATAGEVGHLDVDNREAFGPEHYFTSCDAMVLQEGVYEFAISNFQGAAGRIATLHISSAVDGVIYTGQFVLGDDMGHGSVKGLVAIEVRKGKGGRYETSVLAE